MSSTRFARAALGRWGAAAAAVSAITSSAATLGAQQSPVAVRPLGATIRVAADSFGRIAGVRVLSDGRVLVNDAGANRLVLLDTSLARATVIADTTDATSKAYGRGLDGLIAFGGDSTLTRDLVSNAYLVIDPSGKIARVIPFPAKARFVFGVAATTPAGSDGHGHLLFNAPPTIFLDLVDRDFVGDTLVAGPDSLPLLRLDLATGTVDTLVMLRAPRVRQVISHPSGGRRVGRRAFNPIVSSDDWALRDDGTVAVVRAADYHVDWVRPSREVAASARVPAAWIRITDSMKVAIMDTVRARVLPAGGPSAANASPDGARVPPPPAVVEPSDLPDFWPPFTSGFTLADADGNLWVREHLPRIDAVTWVFDVVRRDGTLADRVQLPAGNTLAGFHAGEVFMISHRNGKSVLVRARLR